MLVDNRHELKTEISRNNKHPHELSNIHLSDVSQCSSYLKENTFDVPYKNQQGNLLWK